MEKVGIFEKNAMQVYKHQTVEELELFYGDLLYNIGQFPDIRSHLTALATKMWEGCAKKTQVLFKEINNYHPAYLGKSVQTLLQIQFTIEDCKMTIANEYGFADWREVEALGTTTYNIDFEEAVTTLLAGDLEALKVQISNNPLLLQQRSNYGHQATLLHYTASNGVEMWRQRVPYNLPSLTTYLLQMGADKKATMKVYGGAFETLPLLLSSAHPQAAGIMEEMKRVLVTQLSEL